MQTGHVSRSVSSASPGKDGGGRDKGSVGEGSVGGERLVDGVGGGGGGGVIREGGGGEGALGSGREG